MAYASKYYDPEKAHEYYMKTRELIGYENRYGGHRGDGTSAASGGQFDDNDNSSNPKKTKQNEVKKHNQDINNRIQNLRDRLKNMSKEDRAANRQAIMDEIQNLREQLKGGSTSGFNQKGSEAAAYIKKQMEEERDEIIKQTNKSVDKEMLTSVEKLASDIKAMRESGHGFSHKQFASKIKALLGQTKKKKIKAKRKYMNDYKEKYKDEIDKLRGDKSMYSYYDRSPLNGSEQSVQSELISLKPLLADKIGR